MYWWQSVEKALESLGGTASLSEIYDAVEVQRKSEGLSAPKSLKAVVRKELEINSSDSSHWNVARDLFYSVDGIGGGVWGLRSLLPRTLRSKDLSELELESSGREVVKGTVSRIVRDTKMVQIVKALHRSRCQICGTSLKLRSGSFYAEAHHIIPIGSPHNGPDIASNIVVVCPNHHALLDFGALRLDAEKLSSVPGHDISISSIAYHNTKIFEGNIEV